MRLAPRFTIPAAATAAAAAAAIAIPGAGTADTPLDHVSCPNSSSGYVLWPVIIAPAAQSKDNNGDGLVCMKAPNSQNTDYKDNNNPANSSTNPDDYTDDLIDGV